MNQDLSCFKNNEEMYSISGFVPLIKNIYDFDFFYMKDLVHGVRQLGIKSGVKLFSIKKIYQKLLEKTRWF